MNEKIAAAAWAMARGEIATPNQVYICLKIVRLIVENALYGGQNKFYDTYLAARTTQPRAKNKDGTEDWTPYASDIEASMKTLGYAVKLADRQPGDLVFNFKAAPPYGHVGVLKDIHSVLENAADAWRPHSIHLGRNLQETPLEHFPLTLVARLGKR